jgi:hypothetical protein
MRVETTAPSRRDPRSPQNAAVGARAAAELKFTKCDRGGCPSKVPVTFERDVPDGRGGKRTRTDAEMAALIRRNLETAGWVGGATPSTAGRFYCGRACRDMAHHSLPDAPARPGTPGGCQKVDCARAGVCICRPAVDVGKNEITRITVVDKLDRQGRTHRAYQCDNWGCRSVSYVEPGTSAEAIARKAAAEGWRQTPEGTVCGAQCARVLKASVASGRQDPVVLNDKSIADAQRPRSEADQTVAAARRAPEKRRDFPWLPARASGPADGVYSVLARPDGRGGFEAACLDVRGLVVRGQPTRDEALAALRRKAMQHLAWQFQNSEILRAPTDVRFVTVDDAGEVAVGRNPGSVLEPPVVVGVPAARQTRATRRVTTGA